MTCCENINIVSQLNNFFTYLREDKQASDNTVQAYARDLDKFLEFASANNITDLCDVNSDSVAEFKTSLNSKGLSSSSVSRTLSSLRSLFKYLMVAGICDTNPAKSVHNDKSTRKDMNVLTSKEI